uniref:Uncharacterized protein n=1 Tax=Siphoviridae sp. ctWdm1 TaxID=2827883 RepID=A0A8S5RY59_9CAUD|nr:MAG TPA: hypothetical protein [Siphoviridae sp. ctWdm1]
MTVKTLFYKCNRKSNSSTTITCITSISPLLFTYCNIIYWNCTIIGINLNLFCIPITSSR